MNALTHGTFFESPTVPLENIFPHSSVRVYAKLDNLQMSGSTKERTAASLIAGLIAAGAVTRGGTIVESTSGNLGMALARQCALQGITFIAVVDERANRAALQTMAAYGATVDLVPTPADGNRLRARVARVAELLESIAGAVTTNQYANPNNPKAHATSTFPEIAKALGRAPDRLYVATSTAGTILGCLNGVREIGAHTQVVGVDSVGSVLFGGASGDRLLPGLGAGFETELSRQVFPHAVHRMPEFYMIKGARTLATREGILAGASTGALVAAVGADIHVENPSAQTWVLLVHDGGAPYLPTVYNDQWVSEHFNRTVDLTKNNPFAQLAHGRTVNDSAGFDVYEYHTEQP